MNRIDRLHAILTVLQSKRVVRAEDLAARFDLSIRTIYRDLKALEESGVPIGAEAGVGYFLIEGYHLPPVMFTRDEARSLLLAGMFLDKHSDQATREQFQNAITKVRAILDADKQDDLDGLEQKIIIHPFSRNRPEPEDLRLNTIKQALSNNNVVDIQYLGGIHAEASTRTIEPIGLCYYNQYWHLIAWCQLRKDYRDFRLDRISELSVRSERFLRIKHPSLKEYLDKMRHETMITTAVVKIHESKLPYIQNSKYSMGLMEETREGEWATMTFASFSNVYFSRWLLMLGTAFEVISPQELKDEVVKVVKELAGKYSA